MHRSVKRVPLAVAVSGLIFGFVVSSFQACKKRNFNVSSAHHEGSQNEARIRPKLVVFLIVDQMRPDYIERFRKAFEKTLGPKKGFLAFKDEGVWFENGRTSGAPTVTAAGHASICTGADASRHGIVANAFWLPEGDAGRLVESASDANVSVVRTSSLLDPNGYDAKAKTSDESSSPARLRIPSFAETLHLRSGGASRSLSVSVKDRGSVFCGGKGATGAYWIDDKTASMATSSFFAQRLPSWVEAFNLRNRPSLSTPWQPSLSREEARALIQDELSLKGLDVRSSLSQFLGNGFPYVPKNLGDDDALARKRFVYTPAASDLIASFAVEALKQERLGQNSGAGLSVAPDFLSVSFSSPDYVGHQFGSDSFELFDTYVKLNQTIERLRQSVEGSVGAQNVLWVLTADHGAQRMPEVSQLAGRQAGRMDTTAVLKALRDGLNETFDAPELVDTFSTDQVYLNEGLVKRKGLAMDKVVSRVREILAGQQGVLSTLTRADVQNAPDKDGNLENDPASFYKRGFDAERSGHVFVVLKNGWLGDATLAGTHGTVYEDDARIPFVFMGAGLKSNKVTEDVRANDIAPTVLSLLGYASGEKMNGLDRSRLLLP